MHKRIVAAWKVLRGEWTAKPPEPTVKWYFNGVPLQGNFYTTSGSNVYWGQTR